MEIEERLRAVETAQAVGAAILSRIEKDLASIANSSSAIEHTVTKWKGGIGAIVLIGGSVSAAIAFAVEMITRKIFGP